MDMLFPEGLDPQVMRELNECVSLADGLSVDALRDMARKHVKTTREAHLLNRLLDVSLAEALLVAIEAVFASWDRVPSHARPWCRAMVQYFISSNSGENHDFASCVGFDDDAAVINACLRMAGREDLLVDPEAVSDGL